MICLSVDHCCAYLLTYLFLFLSFSAYLDNSNWNVQPQATISRPIDPAIVTNLQQQVNHLVQMQQQQQPDLMQQQQQQQQQQHQQLQQQQPDLLQHHHQQQQQPDLLEAVLEAKPSNSNEQSKIKQIATELAESVSSSSNGKNEALLEVKQGPGIGKKMIYETNIKQEEEEEEDAEVDDEEEEEKKEESVELNNALVSII